MPHELRHPLVSTLWDALNCRLLNEDSGPEIVDFADLNGPSYRKTHWKRWGGSPPTFCNGFCGKRGPNHEQFPGPEAPLSNLKYIYTGPGRVSAWLGLAGSFRAQPVFMYEFRPPWGPGFIHIHWLAPDMSSKTEPGRTPSRPSVCREVLSTETPPQKRRL